MSSKGDIGDNSSITIERSRAASGSLPVTNKSSSFAPPQQCHSKSGRTSFPRLNIRNSDQLNMCKQDNRKASKKSGDVRDDGRDSVELDALPEDRTMLLYESMPKGLQYYLSTGPPRKFKVNTEEKNVKIAYERLLYDLEQQRQSKLIRWNDVEEKQSRFRQDILNHDVFLKDKYAKTAAAKSAGVVALLQRRAAESKYLDMRAEYIQLMQRKKWMLSQLRRHERVRIFVEETVTHSGVKHFKELMNRYKSLQGLFVFKRRICLRGHEIANEIDSLHGELVKDYRNQHFELKSERDRLIHHLATLRYEKLTLTSNMEMSIRESSDRERDYQLAINSIKQMGRNLSAFRSFASRRLAGCTSAVELIEQIGILVLEYTELYQELELENLRRKHRRSTLRR